MTFYFPNQNTAIAAVFCLGVLIALLYDAFSVPDKIVKIPKAVVFVKDLLFCFIACALFILTIYIANYGYVRWYEYVFLCLGFGAYRVLFERHILWLLVKATRLVLRIIAIAFSVALMPIKLLNKFVCSIFKMLSRKICILYRKHKLTRFSKKYISSVISKSKNGF